MPFLAMTIFLFINGFEPFGSAEVLTSSGNEEMLTNLFRFNDFIHGLYKDNDISAIWNLYLTDPTNLIICLFPKDIIPCLINTMFCFKLGLSGLFSFYLFKHTDISVLSKSSNTNKNILALLLSFCYSFSGYMIGYGMNITYLSVVAIFPLYLLFLDKLITTNEWKKYYLILGISFVLNVYMTFMILVFSVIYTLLQNYNDLKSFLKTIYQKTLSDLLAAGTTSFIIIPYIRHSLKESFFCTDAPNSMCVTSFFDIFSRLLTGDVPSVSSDTAHGVDIYMGILPVFVILLYILNSEINIFDKIKKISFISILFISTNVLAPNILFNAFKESDMNICFFGFELILFILLLCQETVYHINGLCFKKIMASFITFITLIVTSLLFAKSYLNTTPYIVSLILIFVYALIIMLIPNLSKYKTQLLIFTCIIVFLELVCSAYNGISLLSKKKLNYYESNSYNYYVAENSIREVYPTANITIYNNHDISFNPVFNSLNGVDFVLAEDIYGIPDACLEYVSSVKNINIFKNNYSIDNYIYLPKDVTNWVFSSTSPYLSSNELLNYASNDKIELFSKIDSAYADISEPIKDDAGNDSTERHDVTIAYKPESNGHIYSSFMRPSYLGFVAEEDTSFTKNYDMTIKNVNSLEQIFCFYKFDTESFLKQLTKLSISDANKSTSQSSITIAKDGYILMSVGQKPTNALEIDGSITSNICIDDYLWLAPINAGNHDLSLRSNYSYLPISIILTAIAMIILLIRINPGTDKSINNIITKTNKIKTTSFIFVKTYYVYIVSVIFSIGLILMACLINGTIPFGKASVMASDGYVQTYPSVQAMIDNLSIKSLIPSYLGFGTLIFSCGYDYIASTLGTIIQLLFRLFIWTNNGMAYAAIQAAFYMIISGPAMIFYLTHRYSGKRYELNNPYLILISLFFTFSEYMIGYFVYSNFIYGLFVPIILLAFERMFYKKKPLAYTFILAYIMIRGYYTAFLLCEFLVIYFFIQNFSSIKDFFLKGLRFAISSILAAGIAISTILPAFISTQNATYLADDTNVTTNTFNLYSSIFKTISQYKAYHYGIISTGDDNLVNYYAGLVPLLFVFIYLFNNNISKSLRIRKGIVSLFFIYAFGNNLMNYVFHGFHFQSNVPNRFAIFFVFLMLTMFADTILDIKEISHKRVIIPTTVASIVLITIWLIYPEENKLSLIFSIVLIVCYITIIMWKRNDKKQLTKMLAYISIIELVISSLLAFSSCIGYRNQALTNNLKSIKALNNEYINKSEDDIFISEYLTSSEYNLNMGRITGQNTITGFQSGMSNQICSMSANWGIFSTNNYLSYGTGNPLADMMLHVKYQFIDKDDSEYCNSSIYERKGAYNNIELYENPYYLPIGFVIDKDLGDFATMNKSDFDTMVEYQNAFSQKICGKDLYTVIGNSNKNLINNSTGALENESTSTNTCTISENSSELNVYGVYNINLDISVNNDVKGKIYALYKGEIKYVGDTEKPSEESKENSLEKDYNITLYNYPKASLEEGPAIDIAVLNENVLKEMYDSFSKSTLTDISISRKIISGKVNVSNSGTMYISLPNYNNLKIYIDGTEVKKTDYLIGTGIKITDGNHNITIKYVDNSLIFIILTIICIFISIIIYTYYNKYNNRNN